MRRLWPVRRGSTPIGTASSVSGPGSKSGVRSQRDMRKPPAASWACSAWPPPWTGSSSRTALRDSQALVNNAGISGPTAPIEEMDPDAWEKVLQVNLTGTFNVTRLSIPHLKHSRAGLIINMSSVAGRFGYPNRSPYSTSKWGLIGFTKTLSIELGKFGIRANAILPSAVEGLRLQRVFEGRAQQSGHSVEEVSKAALSIQSIK